MKLKTKVIARNLKAKISSGQTDSFYVLRVSYRILAGAKALVILASPRP